MAVNLVLGGRVQKRERPQKFCRGRDFPFLESESDLSRYCQLFVILLSVLDKACVGESTRPEYVCLF